ncbi:MAG: hypothetical protein OXI79_11705 [Gammaproteobacteria bacterium]|nr:hypothetical protein [Gammaproteobacteria bacterium]
MSKRKPYNRDAGYKCSLKTPFGHAVVYDRERGGGWIDGEGRWVVAAYDRTGKNIGLLDCRTAGARQAGHEGRSRRLP